MSKLRTLIVSVLIAALVGLGAAGCGHRDGHEHPQNQEKSAEETPAEEHPSSEHPSGEHPG